MKIRITLKLKPIDTIINVMKMADIPATLRISLSYHGLIFRSVAYVWTIA